jgi:hypothetical protein
VEQAIVSHSLENHSYLHANLETSALAYLWESFISLTNCVNIIKLFPSLLTWMQNNRQECLLLKRIVIYIEKNWSQCEWSKL